MICADSAWVGQANRCPSKIVDREFIRTRAANHVLVAGPECCKVHVLGGFDVGHQQLAGAI